MAKHELFSQLFWLIIALTKTTACD